MQRQKIVPIVKNIILEKSSWINCVHSGLFTMEDSRSEFMTNNESIKRLL